MRTLTRTLASLLLALGLLVPAPAEAADKIRVVATTTDLKALTEAVGGDLVEVDALARGNQNPHDLEVRPSLMVKVRRADLLVMNGLELDQWAEVVVQGANNPEGYSRGARAASTPPPGILVLEVPRTRVDRSMGDVHPVGNPHYTLDPGMAPSVTANILEGLARVAPAVAPAFERSRSSSWPAGPGDGPVDAALAPFKGAKVVVDHNMWLYFLTRFGLVQAGSVEERPGIPPTPAHLTELIALMKEQKIKVIVGGALGRSEAGGARGARRPAPRSSRWPPASGRSRAPTPTWTRSTTMCGVAQALR